MVKITCRYEDRKTHCPMGTQVFTGKNLDEVCVLAANYLSDHPDYIETSCVTTRTSRRS